MRDFRLTEQRTRNTELSKHRPRRWLSVTLAYVILCLAAEILGGEGGAQRVIGYRNDFTGVYADATPPLTWKATVEGGENVVWRMPLPGPAETSQPIIVGDRIIVMSQPFYLSCFDKMTGKLLWERRTHGREDSQNEEERKAFLLERYVNYMMAEVIERYGYTDPCEYARPLTRSERYVRTASHMSLGKANLTDEQKAKIQSEFDAIMAKAPPTWEGCNVFEVAVPNRKGGDYDASYTALATPVSDGKHIYAHFSTGVAVCYDLEGRLQWLRLFLDEDGKRIASPPSASGGYNHASPLLLEGRLYLPRLALNKDSKKVDWGMGVYCLDAASGSTLWNKFMGRMTHVGLLSVVRETAIWIVAANGAIFQPDGSTVYGSFTEVGSGGNSGPFFGLDRERGIAYHPHTAFRLPDVTNGVPCVLWHLEVDPVTRRRGRSGTGWLAQYVPPGDSPLPLSRLAEAQARSLEGDRGRSFRGAVRNHAAPVVHQGNLYHFNSAHKTLSASDVSQDTLENMFYSHALPQLVVSCRPGKWGDYLHSPHLYGDLAIAGDYLYVPGVERTAVLRVGKQFDLLAVNEHETMVGTLVFNGDRIYLRGVDHLYCLGGPKATERIPSVKPEATLPVKGDFPVVARRLIDETVPRLLPILWNLDAAESVKLVEQQLSESNREFRNVVLLEALSGMSVDRSALLPSLLKVVLNSRFHWYRVAALNAVGSLGPDAASATTDLLKVMYEQDTLIKRHAVRAIGNIGPKAQGAIPALVKMLPDSSIPIVEGSFFEDVRLALEKIRGVR